MKVIAYQVELLEPTLVGSLGGEPNSARAFDYLPGSVLRGAIIAKYIEDKKKSDPAYQFDAAADEVRRLFLNSKTRYLNGYRLDGEARRTLPTPISWQQDKDDVARQSDDTRAPIYDFAVDDDPDECLQPKGVSAPFCFLSGAAHLVTPDRHLTVHTQRTRRFGRAMPRERITPDDNEGAVYRYDALAAGQTFEATILCDDDTDAAKLAPLLKGQTTLGGSRSGGYGRVEFLCLTTSEEDDRNEEAGELAKRWREVDSELTLDVERGKLIVTLLSDALLRDENGQFAVDDQVASATIRKRLGVHSLNLLQSFYAAQPVGGFNRKWGLPLPQALAMRMGSVFVFEVPQCLQGDLDRLEAQGIGERRAEGFGRVAINWHQEERLDVEPPRSDKPDPVPIPADAPGAEIAQRMVARLLRRQLDERVIVRANALGKQIRQPKPSQLSRLRLIIQDELRRVLSAKEPSADPSATAQMIADSRDRLEKYLAGLDDRQATRKQFNRDYPAGKPLIKWLSSHIADEADIWMELSEAGDLSEVRVGGIAADRTSPILAYEYNLRLIDAVLARAAKLKRKEEQ